VSTAQILHEGVPGYDNAEDREHARRAVAAFKLAYGAKFGEVVAKITADLDELLRSTTSRPSA
jgi:hypothetical protein